VFVGRLEETDDGPPIGLGQLVSGTGWTIGLPRQAGMGGCQFRRFPWTPGGRSGLCLLYGQLVAIRAEVSVNQLTTALGVCLNGGRPGRCGVGGQRGDQSRDFVISKFESRHLMMGIPQFGRGQLPGDRLGSQFLSHPVEGPATPQKIAPLPFGKRVRRIAPGVTCQAAQRADQLIAPAYQVNAGVHRGNPGQFRVAGGLQEGGDVMGVLAVEPKRGHAIPNSFVRGPGQVPFHPTRLQPRPAVGQGRGVGAAGTRAEIVAGPTPQRGDQLRPAWNDILRPLRHLMLQRSSRQRLENEPGSRPKQPHAGVGSRLGEFQPQGHVLTREHDRRTDNPTGVRPFSREHWLSVNPKSHAALSVHREPKLSRKWGDQGPAPADSELSGIEPGVGSEPPPVEGHLSIGTEDDAGS
jgi:hypothetical protein